MDSSMTKRTVAIILVLSLSTTVFSANPQDKSGAPEPQTELMNETLFFQKHEKPVELKAGPEEILFANRHVGIALHSNAGVFLLARIYGIRDNQDYLTEDFEKDIENLWAVVLRTDLGRDKTEKKIHIADAKTFHHSILENPTRTTVFLTWGQIDIGNEKNVMEVRVSVTLKEGDPKSYWRIRVRNDSKVWGVWQVHFPMLRLVPIGGTRADNVFIYTKDRGRVIENCFDVPSGFGHGLHADEPAPIGFGQPMPGTMTMQFQALYNKKNGFGLFLTTYDSRSYMKHLRVINNKTNLQYMIGHDPADMGYPGEDYEMSYDFAVGPFTGDWYDACRIYRNWAVNQPWCSKGPLWQRKDIPKWLKEAPLFLLSRLYSDEKHLSPHVKVWLEYLQLTKVPIGGVWYGWKHYETELTAYDKPSSQWRFRPERPYPCANVHDGAYPGMPAVSGLSQAYNRIRKAGGYPAPYVCLQIYDQGRIKKTPYADAARPCACRDVNGNIKNYPHEPSWLMCARTEWWRGRLKETCVELLKKEHAGGVYLDTMHGGAKPCFAIEHGHSHGGGTYRAEAMSNLARICRQAVKTVDANAYTFGESPAENMIDVIDGILYQYTLRAGTSRPVFATVYQDYIPRWGMKCDLNEGEAFFTKAGSLFIEGAQIGRIDTSSASPTDPNYAEQVAYLKRFIGYYHQDIAKKFLCYGRLLRPLSFSRPDPMPLTNYKDPRSKGFLGGIIRLPHLQSGVFRAADGEIGIFIVNVGPKQLAFSTTVQPADYGFSAGRLCDVESITWDGKRQIKHSNVGDSVSLVHTLGGRGVIMYRLVPKKSR